MLDDAAHHSSDNNCGNWNKKEQATYIVLSIASSVVYADKQAE
jgi:hypothetical protein